MQRYITALLITFSSFGFFSCGATSVVKEKEKEKEKVTYTLKNKKELLNQRITNKKSKTVLASL